MWILLCDRQVGRMRPCAACNRHRPGGCLAAGSCCMSEIEYDPQAGPIVFQAHRRLVQFRHHPHQA